MLLKLKPLVPLSLVVMVNTFAENYEKEHNDGFNNAVKACADDGVTRELSFMKQADNKAKLEYMKAEEH